jgi:hypothetical protein
VTRLDSLWNAGYRARRDSLPASACPSDGRLPEGRAWRRGWRVADGYIALGMEAERDYGAQSNRPRADISPLSGQSE